MPSVTLDILGTSCIRVGGTSLRPTSPQLFGAALFLSLEATRGISREELLELLFAQAAPRPVRSHNLRQLLYRLTSLGFPLESEGRLIRVDGHQVASPLGRMQSLPRTERIQLPSSAFAILPGYEPALPRPFTEWFDRAHAMLHRCVRGLLESDLAYFQQVADSSSVSICAQKVLEVDTRNLPALCALVEASLLRQQPDKALQAVDDFLEDCDHGNSAARLEAQRLRQRITKRPRSPFKSPLIGRSETLGALSQAWQLAENSHTQCVLVCGPAGIGKSRLASAVRELASSRGAHVVDYCCGDQDRHRPLSLFARLSAQLLSLPGGLGISPEAFSRLTRLSRLDATPRDSANDAIEVEVDRAELHDALLDLFDAVSAETRLLVTVDDAHRLDSASWAVLRALVTRIRSRSAMLLLCTRSTTRLEPPAQLPQCQVLTLRPLPDADSLALLLTLAPHFSTREREAAQALRMAGGNPFFIQAVAQHPWTSATSTIPRDISTLAASSYHAMNSEARTVLESILLLGNLATIDRVRAVSVIPDAPLLQALRFLEEEGLTVCAGDTLRCSHDLLADALVPLIPASVSAVLKQRIARSLEAEVAERGFDMSLALAAADAQLSLNNPALAARLLRRCAAHAALLGEQSEGARMLSRLLSVSLPPEETVEVLDELVRYAELGGERSIRAQALRAKLLLLERSSTHDTSDEHLAAMRLGLAEADLNEASAVDTVIEHSHAALSNEKFHPALRLRAGISRLVLADLTLDTRLAHSTWGAVQGLSTSLKAVTTEALRARLIYNTVFGNPATAIKTARQILRTHALTSLDAATISARRNALFALQILGETHTLYPSAAATYDFMMRSKLYSEALYVATAVAESAMGFGKFDVALIWLTRSLAPLERLHHSSQNVVQAYATALSLFASVVGEYEAATELLAQARQRLRIVQFARFRAITVAHEVRLGLLRGQLSISELSLKQLRSDYEAGSRLGRQDTIVEALWLAYHSCGQQGEASAMIADYVAKRRREPCPVDWVLWSSTKTDPVWCKQSRRIPRGTQLSDLALQDVTAAIGRGLELCRTLM